MLDQAPSETQTNEHRDWRLADPCDSVRYGNIDATCRIVCQGLDQ